MSDSDEHYITSVYLRKDQQVVQKVFPQKFSEMVRHLADAMIKGTDLSELPPEIAQEVVISRSQADLYQAHIENQTRLKDDFFLFLDSQNLPVVLARVGQKKARRLAKDFVTPYRAKTGNILPECYVGPFLKEYFQYAEISGKMKKAWIPIQDQMVEDFKEKALAED